MLNRLSCLMDRRVMGCGLTWLSLLVLAFQVDIAAADSGDLRGLISALGAEDRSAASAAISSSL